MKILALDVGDVRVGLAYTDALELSVNPLESYRRKNTEEDFTHIADIIKSYRIEKLVVGLPLNMDGTEGPRVEATREFVDSLSKYTDLPVVWQDERLTTVTAENLLIEQGMRREKRKNVIDKVAAMVILSSYLDSKH